MGDRTSVMLEILSTQAEKAETFFDGDAFELDESPPITTCTFQEVNYGNLPYLKKLRDNGIAYNSIWSSGSNYSSGAEYGRYTSQGVFVVLTVYDDCINPDLDSLLKMIEDHTALKEYLLEHQKKVTPLPWDNQEAYGKLYQVMRLIT